MRKRHTDLHSHTLVSYDSCNRFDWIINRCLKVGIDCLAITDHNEIRGALEMQKRAPFQVIVGEEVNTGEGELIGLFIKELITSNLGIARTIEAIKGQDGLVYIPHPLSVNRKSALNVEELLKCKSSIDIVEAFNSRTRKEMRDRGWMDSLLDDGRIIRAAGSDAHSPGEFGNVLIEMDDFLDKDEFLFSLSRAKIKFRKTSLLMRIVMNYRARKFLRRLL